MSGMSHNRQELLCSSMPCMQSRDWILYAVFHLTVLRHHAISILFWWTVVIRKNIILGVDSTYIRSYTVINS